MELDDHREGVYPTVRDRICQSSQIQHKIGERDKNQEEEESRVEVGRMSESWAAR